MKLVLLLLGSLLAIKSCNFDSLTIGGGEKGSGKLEQIELPIGDYSQIDNTSQADIIYEQRTDTTPYCKLEIDDNLRQYVSAEVKDGLLKIKKSKNIKPTQFKIYTNSKGLNKISNSGLGNILLKGSVSGDSLEVKMHGSGDFRTDAINYSNLVINSRGSSDFCLKGSATKVKLSLRGSGDVYASNLLSKNVSCSLRGSGDVKVNVSDSLDIQIKGSGDVKYKGKPLHILQSVKGSGDITPE